MANQSEKRQAGTEVEGPAAADEAKAAGYSITLQMAFAGGLSLQSALADSSLARQENRVGEIAARVFYAMIQAGLRERSLAKQSDCGCK